jgi:hypothetical protein
MDDGCVVYFRMRKQGSEEFYLAWVDDLYGASENAPKTLFEAQRRYLTKGETFEVAAVARQSEGMNNDKWDKYDLAVFNTLLNERERERQSE